MAKLPLAKNISSILGRVSTWAVMECYFLTSTHELGRLFLFLMFVSLALIYCSNLFNVEMILCQRFMVN